MEEILTMFTVTTELQCVRILSCTFRSLSFTRKAFKFVSESFKFDTVQIIV